MGVWVGTSGWSYEAWKGPFYPEDLPSGDMLRWYAGRLTGVEVNNTFYRLPKREVLRGWREQTPDGFSFVLKASRRITHQAKLGPDAESPLAYLMDCTSELGPRRGPVLFQTPPWLKRDIPLLETFLGWCRPAPSASPSADAPPASPSPGGDAMLRAAFEFRSTSWFDEEVYDVLRRHGAALVVADTGDEAKDPPLVATAPFGYARLRRERYQPGDLEAWAERLTAHGWADLWVFFKHEDEGAGPRLATRFRELVGA